MAIPDSNGKGRSKEEAVSWFVRMTSGDATPDQRRDHAAWLANDPQNLLEYDKLAQMWADLDHIDLAALSGTEPGPKVPSPFVALPRKAPGGSDHPAKARKHTMTRRRFLGGGAALAAGTAGALVLPREWQDWRADHVSGIGELRDVPLPDGSFMQLDADSAVALDFSQNRRTLQLLRGRAFFDVAHDETRPFTVSAGKGKLTAQGTRFIVHEWADQVTVSVAESTVEVSGPLGLETREVATGQTLSYSGDLLGPVSKIDLEIASAWRKGKLVFEDRPLRQVLSDVNRYRPGIIRATSDRLLNMRVSGIFDVSNPDGVLDAIRQSLPVKSFSLSPYLVLLHPA